MSSLWLSHIKQFDSFLRRRNHLENTRASKCLIRRSCPLNLHVPSRLLSALKMVAWARQHKQTTRVTKEICTQDVFGLTEISLQLILSRVQNLERIALNNCKNVFDYTALGSCGRLQSLEIRNTTQLANEDIFTVCTYGNLKRLVLSNCFNFSSRGVNIALMRCQLKEVCSWISLLPQNHCARLFFHGNSKPPPLFSLCKVRN